MMTICCCDHPFTDHDPGGCTARDCWCRGFHDLDARRELHAALHGGIGPCACPVNPGEGLGGIQHEEGCSYA